MKDIILPVLILLLIVSASYFVGGSGSGLGNFFKDPFLFTPTEVQKKPSATTVFERPPAKIEKPPVTIPATPAPLQEIPEYLIPAGFKRDTLSPYFRKARISSASYYAASGQPTTITLSSSLGKDEKLNITGWKIKSNRREVSIAQAIEVYEPNNLGLMEDIILKGNNYLYLYSNESAIKRNFRLNKCTGYLENLYDFNPALPKSCPTIPRSESTYLSGSCQSYIFSLGNCQLPDANIYNSFPGTDAGNACREFLNTISFDACFNRHKNDPDFLSAEWRLWVNDNILDSQHDRLWIFDKKGLLVDEYIY
ncbi:MAG: hypothetical protein HYR95_01705 [Candidatus Colwellbacteria bacterium]|nr:hypothetical protein [Candidatus Colwellbacteria bacterium]MBI3273677.1 hypothetical protein [Candidatus Colwellbacteria bacterium]